MRYGLAENISILKHHVLIFFVSLHKHWNTMVGRQTKLTDEFLKIAESVLDDDINCIIFTDEELIAEINDRLPEEARITDTTFKNWKCSNLKNDIISEFLILYRKAERKQKRNLFNELRKQKPGEWQKYAWIIERKFPAWNLKSVQEHNIKAEPIKVIIEITK